ncbi:MAG: hypothetical protein WA364_28310 [Candidatus Nitrosopolaris sp.]
MLCEPKHVNEINNKSLSIFDFDPIDTQSNRKCITTLIETRIEKKKTSQDPLDSRLGSLQSSESRVPMEDRSLMNQCKIPLGVNNDMCEAAGCFSPAEVQIEIKVGQLGNISLSLCNDCVGKFSD